MRVSARARVNVTFEVDADSAWGGECAMDQIHKQAAEGVLAKLNKTFPFVIVGKVEVKAIVVSEIS